MALKPQELELRVDEIKVVDNIEAAIDEGLLSQYVAEKTGYKIAIGIVPTQRIINEIIRRYRAAGWRLVQWEVNGFILHK